MSRKDIMLCYPMDERRITRWGGFPVLVQPKLDGDRCRAILPASKDEKIILYSSYGNIIESVPMINLYLNLIRTFILESDYNISLPLELDGELYVHGMTHQEIRSIVGRTTNFHPDHDKMQFHIFDTIYDAPNSGRLALIESFFEYYIDKKTNIKKVPTVVCTSLEELSDLMKQYNDLGYEGIIVRNPRAPYKRARSTDIMKFKPTKQDAYLIIDTIEEISIKGEPKNALGALICESFEGGERFKVGTGSFLTRKAREELWSVKDSLPGNIANIKYQNLTNRKVPRFSSLVSLKIVKGDKL